MQDLGNVDEQKVSLRALVALSKSGDVTLAEKEWNLLANGRVVPGALTGVRDVAAQMAAYTIHAIEIRAGSGAADLLGVARIVAGQPAPGDEGALARQRIAALRPATITFVAPEPAAQEPPAREPETAPSPASAASSPSSTAPAPAQQEAADMIAQLSAPDMSKATVADVLDALQRSQTADEATRALDDVVSFAEHSVRVGKAGAVGDAMHGVLSQERAVTDADIRRAYVFAILRLSKPAILRAVASQIPKYPEKRRQYVEVLARTGEDGADALIEQVNQAQTAEDRKRLYEVLSELEDAVGALTRMLGDSRWFVVRNAADLLGEMNAVRAEGPLIALLRHADDRVRRSATNALLRLGTPNALKAIYDAVSDNSPEVRIQAAAALSTKKDGKTSATLIRAIEDEVDGDVQLAMIAALGRVATPDAVAKLVRIAEPEQRLFRKKSANLRVAAVQALGEARTPAALTALRELLGDKDREVRETATRALAHASR